MKLKNYEELSIVVVSFATEDVIRTSGEEFGGGWNDLFGGFQG